MKKHLLFFSALLCASVAMAEDTSTPLTVSSGFNVDAICVGTQDAPTAEGPIDGHGSQLVVSQVYSDVAEGEGLPADLKITTDSNHHVYQFGDPTKNNCFYIGITAANSAELGTASSGTVVFSNPSAGDKLGILMCGTNRDHLDLQFNLKVNYVGGTTVDLGSFKVSDWGQGNENDVVYTCTKRYRYDAGSNPESGNFRLSEVLATLTDTSTPIQSVTITTECQNDAWGYGSLAFFAFSTVKSTTGIETVKADNAQSRHVYTIDGKEISAPQKGLNIVKYNDGTVRKVIVNQ